MTRCTFPSLTVSPLARPMYSRIVPQDAPVAMAFRAGQYSEASRVASSWPNSASAAFFPSWIVSSNACFGGSLWTTTWFPNRVSHPGVPSRGPSTAAAMSFSESSIPASLAPRARNWALVGRSNGPRAIDTGARPKSGEAVVGFSRVRDNPASEPVKMNAILGLELNTFPSSFSSAPAFDESSWTSSSTTRQSRFSAPRRSSRSQAVFMGGRGAVTDRPDGPAENPSTRLAALTSRVLKEADSLILPIRPSTRPCTLRTPQRFT